MLIKFFDNSEEPDVDRSTITRDSLQTYADLPQVDTLFTDALGRIIIQVSEEENLPPLLVLELMRQESRFRARVCSSKAACGLMQMIPGTAARFGITAAERSDPEKSSAGRLPLY